MTILIGSDRPDIIDNILKRRTCWRTPPETSISTEVTKPLDSLSIAKRRLFSLRKKMAKDTKFREQYSRVITKYQEEGIDLPNRSLARS